MEISPEIISQLEKLKQKYAAMGQNIESYLDGLLYADYLTYWDYIHLDTLLSLQNPRTPIPDERIFIMYHQITELYFKLILNEVQLLADRENLEITYFKRQLKRLNRYFAHLIDSFDVMVDGMDRDEFLRFRMSLLPASGFQSAQYRQIEIVSTDLHHLVHFSRREEFGAKSSLQEIYNVLYWKSGATELATGKKTLTLKQFEEKYSREFIHTAETYQPKNIWQRYLQLSESERSDEELIRLMRQHDHNVNVLWPLSHYRSAVKYLDQKPEVVQATGGTNWQKYLPPKNQRIIFYPELWNDEELEAWGKRIKFD